MTGERVTAAGALEAALSVFLDAYARRPDLASRQQGWSPVIELRATDTGARAVVRFVDGRPFRDASAEPPSLVVAAEERILREVLALERSPNEPYLFGELVVEGPEADFVRLDYIATELCPP
jgi:hypothetical protein